MTVLFWNPKPKADLVIEHVGFHYVEGEDVLQDINIDIPADQVLALVGATGVGKSTLASLIPRFYEVSLGRILLDGTDIRNLKIRKSSQADQYCAAGCFFVLRNCQGKYSIWQS